VEGGRRDDWSKGHVNDPKRGVFAREKKKYNGGETLGCREGGERGDGAHKFLRKKSLVMVALTAGSPLTSSKSG